MFLVPLHPRDLIRLPPGSALRHILHLCDIGPLLVQAENRCEPTPRQPPFDSVPNQHSSPYAALSLSSLGPISHITSLAAGRPLNRPREGPILVSSDFSLYSSFFFARHARIHTSLLQRECGFLYVALLQAECHAEIIVLRLDLFRVS